MYDFNKIVDRQSTANIKYDLRTKFFGKDDVLPMWVADMDFETPDFIRNAVIKRAEHPIYIPIIGWVELWVPDIWTGRGSEKDSCFSVVPQVL